MMEITGFRELVQKLKELSNDKDKRKEVLVIMRNVAKPTIQAAKYFAPIGKGNKNRAAGSLRASIGTITGKSENPTIYVGPRVKKGRKAKAAGRNSFGDGWYGAMVDQGHNIYTNPARRGARGKSARKSGFVSGKKFMEQAKNSTQIFATKELQEKTAALIQRRINRLSTNV